MEKISGAQIVAETLIEQDCRVVFGYPGGQVLNIFDALYQKSDRIEVVLTAHEQGASHAADGYARVTGKVGVVVATSGPGATNLVTGLATAYLDSIPIVAITGNVPCDLLGRDSFQEVNIVDITKSITKRNFIVKDVTELADTIRLAFRTAASGRPAPVLIDIPKDIQVALAEFEQKAAEKPFPIKLADENELKKAADMIAAAKRPYLYIGGGVITAEAGAEVIALAEKADAPIGSTLMGLSAVPDDHPRFLGMQGMHGRYASSVAQDEADLVITAGARFSDRATGDKERYCARAKMIHIDVDAKELNKNIPVDLAIEGDLKDALARIAALLPQKENSEWRERIAALRETERGFEKTSERLSPYRIVDRISAAAKPDTIIATDVGQHQMWTAQRYPFQKPRTFISSGGLGTMGYGLGAAIGAAKALGRHTILITGDGSFGMNLNELATAVSQKLPLVIVIMNNGVLGMVRQWQTLFYGKRYANTTLNRKTDFVKLAEAFGAAGYRAETDAELTDALANAFSSDGTTVIDCAVNCDEFVLPMLPPGGSIDDIITELEVR
ncbi:MAG: biosynthetic-type acetolactate synthase large subunit [Bacteroides sp.]|nr:biosynthetic-type acetolactate synthase large subunit [Eubacterium sp.]MCM1417479.1 biosynthetic-type acetolactate synthase large subunit [Roseburia sp.]MCM1461659.1 biosynthetic-type acetolactate synthase large subunit [Bacteroides sp.]